MSFTKAKIIGEITDKKNVRKMHVTVNYRKRVFDDYIPYRSLPSEIYVEKYFIQGNKVFFSTNSGFNSAFRGMNCSRMLTIDYGYHYSSEWVCWYELPIVEILKDGKGKITKIRSKKNTLIIR